MKDFDDIHLKLGIISCLTDFGYYIDEAEKLKHRKSYSREYQELSYSSMLPEVFAYYRDLDIPQEFLDKILVFSPGAGCYNLLVKEWDGEGDEFEIVNLNGIQYLRNMIEFDGQMLSETMADISKLLECPNLKRVYNIHFADNKEIAEVLCQLKTKGVEVIL